MGVDWGRLGNRIQRHPTNVNLALYYIEVLPNVPIVAHELAHFLLFLIQSKVLQGPEHVQLVGFSLGAHVAALASQEVKRKTKKKIHRITGLDPAGRLSIIVLKKLGINV